MRKIYCLVIAGVMLLTSCGSAKQVKPADITTLETEAAIIVGISPEESEVQKTSAPTFTGSKHRISSFTNLYDDGELYLDSDSRLCYINFSDMSAKIICSREGCDHSDPESCQAYGMENGPMYYGENIYYFEESMYPIENGYKYVTSFMRADLDGGNRQTVFSIDDRTTSQFDMRLVVDGVLYFITQKAGIADGTLSNYRQNYLCSYDFNTGEYKEIVMLFEGWNGDVSIYDISDGKMFYSTTKTDGEISWQAYGDTNIAIDSINSWYTYDLETGEIVEADIISAYPIVYSPVGTYIFRDRSGQVLMHYPDGIDVPVIEDTDFTGFANGLLFSTSDGVVMDPRTQSKYKCNIKEKTGSYDPAVIAYYDGNYIVKDSFDNSYCKVPENEAYVITASDIGNVAQKNTLFPYNLVWSSYTDHPDSLELAAMTSEERYEKMAKDRRKYYDMLNPELPERTKKYYEALEIDYKNISGSSTYLFSGDDYYYTEFTFLSVYFVGAIIDTDLESECALSVTVDELNIDTGELRHIEKSLKNSEGECGLKTLIYPEEGFYIVGVEFVPHFSTIGVSSKSSMQLDEKAIRRMIQNEERTLELLDKE